MAEGLLVVRRLRVRTSNLVFLSVKVGREISWYTLHEGSSTDYM